MKPKKPNGAKLFEKELARRRITFERTDDGAYELVVDGWKLVLNPDNVLRDVARDGNPDRIVTFLDSALGALSPLPPWKEARKRVYWSAEPANMDFGETIREVVSDTVVRVAVVTTEDEGRITWLTRRQLKKWGVTVAEVRKAAYAGLDRLLRGIRLNVGSAKGRSLGMVPLHSAFKASVVFAPRFKRFVEKDLGWPVLAVIPCRDFVYVLAERDRELLDSMGGVVQREFRTSGYPITTEVFRISDDGIEAIGKFPE